MRPDLVEVLRALRDATAASIRVALAGRVVRVDAAKGTVAVRVEQRVARPGQGNRVTYEDVPELLTVPVLWPGTSALEMTFELVAGDPGLVVFADHALGTWLSQGALVDPDVPDAHGAHGAVFVPGLFPQSERPALPTAPLRARIGIRGGARVEYADGEVRALDGGTARPVAFADEVQEIWDYLALQFNTATGHKHAVSGAATTTITNAPGASIGEASGTTVFKGE